MTQQNTTEHAHPPLNPALEYAGIGTWYWYSDEDRVECCDTCKRHLALSEDISPSIAHFFSALSADDRQRLERQMSAIVGNELERFQEELRVLQPDGSLRWLSVYVIKETCSDAMVVAGILNDITGHKQQAIGMHNDLTLFRNIYERAKKGIAIGNMKGDIERCNPAFAEMLGYTETELRRMNFSVLIHPEDLAANVEQAQRVFAGELDSFSIENRYCHKDGHTVWVNKLISVLLDESGMPHGMLALISDISALKAVEDELTESRYLFELALTGSELGIWDVDISSEQAHYDARYLAMLGYEAHEFEPTLSGWKRLIHPDDQLAVKEAMRAHLSGETRLYQTEHRLRHKAGHWVWVQAKGKVLYDGEGRPIRATGTQLDITDRKRVATEGAELLQKIEALINGLERKPSEADHSLDDTSKPSVRLTLRNQQVLALLAEGLTAAQIAERLDISYDTVVTHRRTLMNKLGLKNKAELIRYALKHDIGMPSLR